jgi:hypothetical protein
VYTHSTTCDNAVGLGGPVNACNALYMFGQRVYNFQLVLIDAAYVDLVVVQ